MNRPIEVLQRIHHRLAKQDIEDGLRELVDDIEEAKKEHLRFLDEIAQFDDSWDDWDDYQYKKAHEFDFIDDFDVDRDPDLSEDLFFSQHYAYDDSY